MWIPPQRTATASIWRTRSGAQGDYEFDMGEDLLPDQVWRGGPASSLIDLVAERLLIRFWLTSENGDCHFFFDAPHYPIEQPVITKVDLQVTRARGHIFSNMEGDRRN